MSASQEFLPVLSSRKDYFEYLDGWSVKAGGEQFRQQKGDRTLVKTYMLETVRSGGGTPPLETLFGQVALRLDPVEEGVLYRVVDPNATKTSSGVIGLLEALHPRYPVVYTLLRSDRSDPWAQQLVARSPWLDRFWLSAGMFQELWQWVQRAADPRRLVQLKFEYEALFEAPEAPDVPELGFVLTEPGRLEDEELPYLGHRSARFTMTDRIGTIQAQLGNLQRNYQPLFSITQLRIPASTKGGHDVYYDGKVTNRSNSFLNHRQAVNLVLETYRVVTERAEQALWFRSEDPRPDGDHTGFNLHGTPVYLKFSERLPQTTFDRFIETTFGRRGSRLRLVGHPFRLSPTKVHVYGLDQHLWQPVIMELTDRHIYLVLPEGTCGNTVHRLVTNVQRSLDPAVQAWIGDQRFTTLVKGALEDPSVRGAMP